MPQFLSQNILLTVKGCGADLVATETKQCFQSPGYPQANIPDNTDLQCIWNIGKQIENTAILFQVEVMTMRDQCTLSYIDIFANCKYTFIGFLEPHEEKSSPETNALRVECSESCFEF